MRHAGYSLLELLICMTMLAALFPAVSKMYISTTRLHAGQSAVLDRMFAYESVEHDLRRAAREATEVVPEFGAYRTEKRTVVLRDRAGFTVFTVNDRLQPQRIQFRAQADGSWEQRILNYRKTAWRSRFEAHGNTVEFIARPPEGAKPGRVAQGEVRVVAAVNPYGELAR